MDAAILIVLTAATLVAAGYAHLRIPRFTATRSGVMLARGVLVLVGVAFGFVAAAYYPALPAPLVFLSAFGFAHVPAALILLLKRQRHESPS